MPEVKRDVVPVEINYVCDACGQGIMKKVGDMDPKTGDIDHQCLICGHHQVFQWQQYPRIDHIGKDEKI